MILNYEQQAMLDGKYGEGAAYAMKIQFALGEAFSALRMVPIKRAHVALSNQAGDLWFAEKMLNAGAKCRVAPTVNPGFCIGHFNGTCAHPVDAESADHMKRTDAAYRGLGAVLSYNCTPYIATNVPNFGEVCAFSESSATPYVNAVWGARSNRESANSALCAAITGYVPEYGLLLDENRRGDILVHVEADMKSAYEYHLLGMMGDKIGEGIPIFTGLPKVITPEALRNLGAQLNTSGAYGMYHIVGFTPEAPTLEAALGGNAIKNEVVITDKDLKEFEERFSDSANNGKVDFAMFGCPHFTLEEAKYIAEQIEGKQLAIPMYILVSSHARQMADRMGITEVLAAAGAELIPDTCPDQPCWHYLKGKVGITESPKCAYYPRRRGINFVIRDLDTCIEAALTGEVK
ncbi:MAG: aconitase X catalytic domain-containing protein [Oscillospiraceae bacterium]|nr:aconitase X catalytic domain-containing protein [Oscillospiraceae bacterium]